MKVQLLDYYMHDGMSASRFGLKGIVDSEGARQLERARPVADLSLSRRRIPAYGCRSALFVVLALFMVPRGLSAASLKPETIAAWDAYVERANSDLQQRARPGGHFLWALEDPERAAAVRSGEIIVASAPGHNPARVPGGLIHHWLGAMFLPGLKVDDVLQVTRDYEHFKDFYRPSVVDSKTIARGQALDQFSMRIMNKAFFVKTALDADYVANNVRVDEHRFYSTSRTTRVQEVEDYGEPGEHNIPEGQGGGYIWKLFSIARYQQRDGGVYVEFEAIALSRDIPVAARLFVDPLVRRVSRNSLLTSLQQTEQALRGSPALVAMTGTAARSAGIPSNAGRMPAENATYLSTGSSQNRKSGFVGAH